MVALSFCTQMRSSKDRVASWQSNLLQFSEANAGPKRSARGKRRFIGRQHAENFEPWALAATGTF